MRWLASVLTLILLPCSSFAQSDCVDGMVVLRLLPAQNPSLSASPPALGIQAIDQVLAQYSPTIIRPFLASPSGVAQSEVVDQMLRTYIVYYADAESPHVVVADLLASAAVETAFVNRLATKHYFGTRRVVPTDSEFGNQWNLENANDQIDIDAPEAWAIEAGQPSEVIGVIDLGTMVEIPGGFEGVYSLHPDNTYFFNGDEDNVPKGVLGPEDLDGVDAGDLDDGHWPDNVVGFRFPNPPPTVTDPLQRKFWKAVPHNWFSDKHGVYVASIAAARAVGGYGIAGVANGCKVFTLRDGVGVDGTTTGQQEEADAIKLAADFSRVINMSWGFFVDENPPQPSILQAIAYAIGKDCVLVAASGNTDVGPPEDWICPFPANLPQVLTVGSISSSLVKDAISRYDTVGVVDLMAPVGSGIPANSHTDCPPDEPGCPQDPAVFPNFAGTSAACPQAAGVAALIRSRFPGLTQDQVRARMKASAEWYWGTSQEELAMYGAGKVNAYRALSEWGEITGDVVWTANTLRPYLDEGVWVSRPGSRDGIYYVSGDLTIESDATLTINPGVVVKVAPDHEDDAGDPDPTRVRIVVKSGGALRILGNATSRVTFESFTDSPATSNDWSGIEFEAGSSGTLSFVEFKNAQRAIVNYAPLTGMSSITNCTFTNCGTAIESHANATMDGALIANNGVAVDVYAGAASLLKCTIANNAASAIVTRTGTTMTIDKCVIAFHSTAPAVRALSGGMGLATMSNSIVWQNGTDPSSRTDDDWDTVGQNAYKIDPHFCNAVGADYRLNAASPAVAPVPPSQGLYFSERVGALDIGCAPATTIPASSLVKACPAGDAGVNMVVSVDLDGVTRTIAADELRLDIQDLVARVFDPDGILPAIGSAGPPDYITSIQHGSFGGRASELAPGCVCSHNDAADVLLNGYLLPAPASVSIRSPDLNGDGTVNVQDFAIFGYGGFPQNSVAAGDCRDFDGDGRKIITDYAFYGQHNNHTAQFPGQNVPSVLMQSNATVALRFTEEYPTATTHTLSVDVSVDNFAGITAAVFSLAARNERLRFSEWRENTSSIGTVIVAPINRDGEEQHYFGLLASEQFDGSSASLGQLVFDVDGSEPFEVDEDQFVLVSGEVMLESVGGAQVVAQMGGVVGLVFDPATARVYHNRLEQNFPNPFNPTTTLSYSIKDASNVSLTIYDVAGRQVRQLVNERREPGAYNVVWDGRNDTGTTVPSGVYFYKLVAGSFTDTKKMTMLK